MSPSVTSCRGGAERDWVCPAHSQPVAGWQSKSTPMGPRALPTRLVLVGTPPPPKPTISLPLVLLIHLSPAGCLLTPAPPCLLPTGPLCSILVGRFGCRVTVMLGGALASLGMVASSFCRTLSQLYLTAGFITGNRLPISRISGCLPKSVRHKCRQHA